MVAGMREFRTVAYITGGARAVLHANAARLASRVGHLSRSTPLNSSHTHKTTSATKPGSKVQGNSAFAHGGHRNPAVPLNRSPSAAIINTSPMSFGRYPDLGIR
jgi:hypothetical protein